MAFFKLNHYNIVDIFERRLIAHNSSYAVGAEKSTKKNLFFQEK
jgi:hypothetical protein